MCAKIKDAMQDFDDSGYETEPSKPVCKDCNDTGVVKNTEWTGTDDSHEVEHKCRCQVD